MTVVVERDLIELAGKCERLTGPDREIDCLIFELGHRLLTPARRGTIDGEPTGEYFGLNGDLLPERAPRFTGSLDDAMTLVPEGHGFYLRRNCSADGDIIYCNAQVWPFSNPGDDEAPRYWANSPQDAPALALCAAALRTRASMKGEG